MCWLCAYILNNSLFVAHLLLRYGPDLDAEDAYGATPLERALGRGSDNVTQMLIEAGARVHSTTIKYPLAVNHFTRIRHKRSHRQASQRQHAFRAGGRRSYASGPASGNQTHRNGLRKIWRPLKKMFVTRSTRGRGRNFTPKVSAYGHKLSICGSMHAIHLVAKLGNVDLIRSALELCVLCLLCAV